MNKSICRLTLLAIAVQSGIALAKSASAQAVVPEKVDAVIVTGACTTGLKATDSPSPV